MKAIGEWVLRVITYIHALTLKCVCKPFPLKYFYIIEVEWILNVKRVIKEFYVLSVQVMIKVDRNIMLLMGKEVVYYVKICGLKLLSSSDSY